MSILVTISILLSFTSSDACMIRGGMGGQAGMSYMERQDARFYSHFSSSGACTNCHNGLRDRLGNDVSIGRDWASSMMANSALDPLWRAKVSSEVLRSPAIKELIEERCARCHAPMAHGMATMIGSGISLLGKGFFDSYHPYYRLAIDGVSCTLCHQIEQKGLGTEESFTGGYSIDSKLQRPYRRIYGPFTNPFQMPMMRHSGFTPYYASHIEESEFCATCHMLYIPVMDSNGKVIGKIAEQMTYLEWKYSRFADKTNDNYKSCQHCHMPQASGRVAISRMPHRLSPRASFNKHYFVGGNVSMLAMLKKHRADLGVAASSSQFDAAIARTMEQLTNHTASILIEGVSKEADLLKITVRVVNKTGHKFPSGVPARRAWIHLVVADAKGNVVFESGKPNRDGSIAGNNADADPLSFEPHYDIIDSSDKVQVYESISVDVKGNVTYTFLKSVKHIKDNKLLPEGFNKAIVPIDIKPHGEALADPNFIGGSDLITYLVRIQSGEALSEPFSIRATLLYQSISFAFAKDLLTLKTQSDHINHFGRYYEDADKTPVTISSSVMLTSGK